MFARIAETLSPSFTQPIGKYSEASGESTAISVISDPSVRDALTMTSIRMSVKYGAPFSELIDSSRKSTFGEETNVDVRPDVNP